MLAIVALFLLALAWPAAARAGCVATVKWEGVTYYAFGEHTAPPPGPVLGEGEVPGCNDGDYNEKPTPVVIHRVRGLDARVAVIAKRNGAFLPEVYIAEGRTARIAGRAITAPVLREPEEPTNWLAAGLISAAALVPLAYVVFVRR